MHKTPFWLSNIPIIDVVRRYRGCRQRGRNHCNIGGGDSPLLLFPRFFSRPLPCHFSLPRLLSPHLPSFRNRLRFYSGSALLACNATDVLATSVSVRLSVCLSVCLSVRPSVTCWYCVETNEATIMRFSPSSSKIILVSGEVRIVWKFAGDHHT